MLLARIRSSPGEGIGDEPGNTDSDPGATEKAISEGAVFREDILTRGYELAKAHQGAPGVDGQTFEQIETAGREEWLNEGASRENVSTTASAAGADCESWRRRTPFCTLRGCNAWRGESSIGTYSV